MTVLFSGHQVLVPSCHSLPFFSTLYKLDFSGLLWSIFSHFVVVVVVNVMHIEMSGNSSGGWSLLSLVDQILYWLNFIFYNRLLLFMSSNPACCHLLSPPWPDPILWDSWLCHLWPHAFLPLFLYLAPGLLVCSISSLHFQGSCQVSFP